MSNLADSPFTCQKLGRMFLRHADSVAGNRRSTHRASVIDLFDGMLDGSSDAAYTFGQQGWIALGLMGANR
jgi:hypothetical protein